jgi:hypothetical protein
MDLITTSIPKHLSAILWGWSTHYSSLVQAENFVQKLTLIRMTKDEKGLAFFKGLLL